MSRDEQKRRTRERLLQVARASFEQRGFEGTTMRMVADEAGVAVGTVFVHFEDKRDLLCSALFDDLEHVLDAALREAAGGSVRARLHHLTAALFCHYEARPELSRMLLRESLLTTGPWRSRFAGQVQRVHEVVAGWLAQARERQELRPSVDPALGAVAYLSFYYFALIGWIQGQPLDTVGLVDRLLGQHFDQPQRSVKGPS
ncbi:MAG: TetR/AcrR family transcriptional regulator [Myxococcota bacterium]